MTSCSFLAIRLCFDRKNISSYHRTQSPKKRYIICCVFRPGKGCSARRSLVEIKRLGVTLKRWFTPKSWLTPEQMVCGAPVCWSKYTTIIFFFGHFHHVYVCQCEIFRSCSSNFDYIHSVILNWSCQFPSTKLENRK